MFSKKECDPPLVSMLLSPHPGARFVFLPPHFCMNMLASAAATMLIGASAVLPSVAMESNASASARGSVANVVLGANADISASARANASSRAARKAVDHLCVQGHVATRESALATAWASFNTKITNAYAKRKTDLNAAWGTADAGERREKIRAAWKAFKDSKKEATRQWKADRKAAWRTFRENAKKCRADITVEIMNEQEDD